MKWTKEQQKFNTTRAIYWMVVVGILGIAQMVNLYLRSRTANPVYYRYDSHYPELGEYEERAAAAQSKRLGVPDN